MITPRRTALAVVLALAASIVASCGSSGSDGATTTAPKATTSTTAPSSSEPPYAKRGPNEVGTRTIALADGRRFVIWYPAAPSAADQPKESFDIASLLSPELQAKLTPEQRPVYEIDAHPGAEPSPKGPFPVVLYSHGFSGFPELSASVMTHLASWGFVVIAPNHVERSADGLLGTAAKGVTPREGPAVLTDALDATIADAKVASSPLHGLLDTDEVAVTGESAGASDAYVMASTDARIDAFISYSLGAGRPDASGKTAERPVPKVPGMVMAGSADGIIPAADSKAIFDDMDTPKYFVEIADVGHTGFTDACLIGADQGGIVGIVKAAGLDLPANLLKLAADGCGPKYLAPRAGFEAIQNFTVAFLRGYLGVDDAPIGLDQATADQFTPAQVTLTADPG